MSAADQCIKAQRQSTIAGLIQALGRCGFVRVNTVEDGVEIRPSIPWTVINEDDPSSLPRKAGFYLATVETDSGRETHVLEHTAYGKWLHEGEFTFQHGYHFRPIAWAPRPEAYAGEVLE